MVSVSNVESKIAPKVFCDRGLLFSQGSEWKEQRRFSLRTLRDMGFGKISMEGSINLEVTKLIDALKHEIKEISQRDGALRDQAVLVML